jgi:hypothetical protein
MLFLDFINAKMKMKRRIGPSHSAGSHTQQTFTRGGAEDFANQDNTSGWFMFP